jgi:hypothetical protein
LIFTTSSSSYEFGTQTYLISQLSLLSDYTGCEALLSAYCMIDGFEIMNQILLDWIRLKSTLETNLGGLLLVQRVYSSFHLLKYWLKLEDLLIWYNSVEVVLRLRFPVDCCQIRVWYHSSMTLLATVTGSISSCSIIST